jgi:hypothetical protein
MNLFCLVIMYIVFLWHLPLLWAMLQVTTFGKAGSLLIERRPTSEVTEGDSVTLDSVISDLFSRLDRMPRGNEQPACSAAGGVAVYPGQVVSTGKPVLLQFDRTSKKEAVALAKALKKSRSIAESQDDEGSLLEQEALEEEESPQEEQQMAAMVRPALQLLNHSSLRSVLGQFVLRNSRIIHTLEAYIPAPR